MFVTFRLGSLIRLLAATAVVAAVIGILVAGRIIPDTPGPRVVTPTVTQTSELPPVQARP